MSYLTAQNVRDCMSKCLFTDEEAKHIPTDTNIDKMTELGAVIARGIVRNFAFHKARLTEERENIRKMLSDLPDKFMKGRGDGWSFLNLCMTKDDEHWAEHPTMEELCCLAIAAGFGEWLMPRETWSSLPGGVPYFVCDISIP